jgi:hypothetical protein
MSSVSVDIASNVQYLPENERLKSGISFLVGEIPLRSQMK